MPRRINWNLRVTTPSPEEPEGAVETQVATLSGISSDTVAPQIVLEAACQVFSNKGSTAAVLRLRRGLGTGGAVVATVTHTLTAETNAALSIMGVDEPAGEIDAQSYTLTAQFTAGEAGKKGKVSAIVLAAQF